MRGERERETLYLSCGIPFSLLDNSIVNETSPEANWNRRADRQTDGRTDRQTYV